MPTNNEIERLAAMGNALRPDWPIRSLITFLHKHEARSYTDLAVALAYVATDPATQTPARLSEAGPWWTATQGGKTAPVVGPGTEPRCHVFGHEHERARNCRACRADALAAEDMDRDREPDLRERQAGER